MFKTAPRHWLDFLFWPLLKIIWEPFSRKNSHWWHWHDWNKEIKFQTLKYSDQEAMPFNRWYQAFLQLNFGLKKVVVHKPAHYKGYYQRGYVARVGNVLIKKLCTLVLHGSSAGLVGQPPVSFFAVSYPDGKPLQLKYVATTTKDKLLKNIPLT